MICKNCGSLHDGSSDLPGNGWIELVLWLFWLLPGVIYSIWRRSSRSPRCKACGSRDLVDEATPVGRRLLAEHYPDGRPPAAAGAPNAPAVRPGVLLAALGGLAAVSVWIAFVLLV